MIEVLKVTAQGGRQFFSKRLGVLEMMERVPSWQKIERVNMSEKQLSALPEINPNTKVFM